MYRVTSSNLCEPDYREEFFIHGNTCLHQADVVCVVDDPLSHSVRLENTWLVNQIWNHHLLLVGFLEKGQQVHIQDHKSQEPLTG